MTIDGPAGAGKSTVAKNLAERLGFDFLDTGAMYRAVTLSALRAGIAADESERLASLLDRMTIRQEGTRTWLADEDVSAEIREPPVANAVSRFASVAAVRQRLTELQRQTARERDIVTEGRDQGSVVFVDAEFKFFLTASDRERARRRHAELDKKGIATSLEGILEQQRQRDTEDMERELAPLKAAKDAIVVDTTGMTLEQVVSRMELLVGGKQNCEIA